MSRAAIHRQVADRLASDLIQEIPAPIGQRAWPVERYFHPNFPVILAAGRQEFLPVLEDLAGAIAIALEPAGSTRRGVRTDELGKTGVALRGGLPLSLHGGATPRT